MGGRGLQRDVRRVRVSCTGRRVITDRLTSGDLSLALGELIWWEGRQTKNLESRMLVAGLTWDSQPLSPLCSLLFPTVKRRRLDELSNEKVIY